MASYENLTIVQYDRGNMGEFVCLSMHKKIFGEDMFTEKRKNDLGWYFMNIDGTLDCLLYDYHRPRVESVYLQNVVFGKCAYEMILDGEIEEARNTMHAMINYRKLNPNTSPEKIDIENLPAPDYSYDPSQPVLTRIHNFDDLDLAPVFPGANIINIYCPPEKRWIFKFLYLYKKHLDSIETLDQRFKNGVEEFWNFNWTKSLSPKDGLTNVNCYEIFLGNTNSYFGSEYASIFGENFENNKSMLDTYNLDYTRDNVSSEELLEIIRTIYSGYNN
jgi:hypothetical protein